jgi:hypothetical protein
VCHAPLPAYALIIIIHCSLTYAHITMKTPAWVQPHFCVSCTAPEHALIVSLLLQPYLRTATCIYTPRNAVLSERARMICPTCMQHDHSHAYKHDTHPHLYVMRRCRNVPSSVSTISQGPLSKLWSPSTAATLAVILEPAFSSIWYNLHMEVRNGRLSFGVRLKV